MEKIKNLYVGILLFVFPIKACFCDDVLTATYWYIGVRNGAVYSSSMRYDTNGYSYITDIKSRVHYCSLKSGFLCIKSKGFSFSVPKGIIEIETEWYFDGVKYTIEPSFKITSERKVKKVPYWFISHFGNKVKVYVIKAENIDDKDIDIYLYSKTLGLIAIMSSYHTPSFSVTGSFWLSEKCGIGCDAFEKNIPNSARLELGQSPKLKTGP